MRLSRVAFIVVLILGGSLPARADGIDLTKATVVRGSDDPVVAKSVTMLIEEVAKRTGVELTEAASVPKANPTIVVVLAQDAGKLGGVPGGDAKLADKPEAYRVTTGADMSQIWIVGHDPRGVLFGVGYLLRKMEMRPGSVTLPVAPDYSSGAPRDRIRGHQLGYRNANNTWDAWDENQFDQYIRDLAVFGTNAIEVIPDFDATPKESPLMKMTATEMNAKFCRLVASYGLDVWAWHALKGDVSDPALAETELARSREVFKQLPVLDALFIPGGDPGDTPPKNLMPFLAKLSGILQEVHPGCELWVSTQGFEDFDNDYFFDYLKTVKPKWLTGVIFGPWAKMDLREIRERTPKDYRVRSYPDITHSVRCQYPVPNWDRAFAHTLGRECANPRPAGEAHIHHREIEWSEGFVTYSDGVNDDVNKIVWTACGWDPDADLRAVLADYGRYFIGPDVADAVADGLLAQEDNFKGSLLGNAVVDKTLAQWQAIEKKCNQKALAGNWRLQQCLIRAYYDAYIKARLTAESGAETNAYAELSRAGETGADKAMDAAANALAVVDANPPAPELRSRVEELAKGLFDSIGMQLDVKRYKASGAERGAILEGLANPLNDRFWLLGNFTEIRREKEEAAKRVRIDALVNWETPVPGAIYDDLGNGRKEPHLVITKPWEDDPGYVYSPQDEFQRDPNYPQDPGQLEPKADVQPAGTILPRLSWLDQGQTLFRADLLMRYDGLNPAGTYTLRAVYTGRFHSTMSLTADGVFQVHGPVKYTDPPKVVEFPIPSEATKDGKLELRWKKVEGRGCQVAEIWLIPNK